MNANTEQADNEDSSVSPILTKRLTVYGVRSLD